MKALVTGGAGFIGSHLAERLANVKQLIDKLRGEKWPKVDFAAASVEMVSGATGRDFNLG